MNRSIRTGFAAVALTAIALIGCAGVEGRTDAKAPERLLSLRDAMTGSFSSEAQAAADESYFNIVLHMKPMWTWRDDGPWLYVEQAVAAAADRPYRQRVYKLEPAGDGAWRSRVFTFDNPLDHAGAWESGSPLSELAPEDLQERVGCAVVLAWDAETGQFVGATTGNGCASELNGAAYATSEVEIGADRILSWDRGYDATGQQVWGAEKGGYEFLRMTE